MIDETNQKAAAEIRAFAAAFKIAGDTVVTFQRQGRQPVPVRLDDLLKRLERPTPAQAGLFDPKNRP